jgi:hypothetical protein
LLSTWYKAGVQVINGRGIMHNERPDPVFRAIELTEDKQRIMKLLVGADENR